MFANGAFVTNYSWRCWCRRGRSL